MSNQIAKVAAGPSKSQFGPRNPKKPTQTKEAILFFAEPTSQQGLLLRFGARCFNRSLLATNKSPTHWLLNTPVLKLFLRPAICRGQPIFDSSGFRLAKFLYHVRHKSSSLSMAKINFVHNLLVA